MKKRIVSILLALSLLCSLLPASALPARAETTGGSCGDNLTWSFDSSTGTLTIEGSGEMNDYEWGEAPWYGMRESIQRITIGNGVTSIGECAFWDCSALMNVAIPDSVTIIGDYAFFHSSSLKSVTILDSVTSIGDAAFNGCTSLTNVTIGNGVTTIGGGAFRDCISLTSVTIPNSVTSIGGGAFESCTSMTSVTISNSVTSIGGCAFRRCNSLTSVTIPDSVTSIGDAAFNGCSSLKTIAVASGNQNYSSDGSGVLFNKNKTELIQCPGGLDSSYSVPDSVTGIGESAFGYCCNLTSVTIPDSVTSIGDAAFYSCSSLKTITVASGNPNYSSDGSGVLFNKSKTELIQCPGGLGGSYSVPDSVTSIGDNAFYCCTSLTNVMIGNGVRNIGRSSFYGCTSLTSMTIPNSVTSIGGSTFAKCTSLTSVTIPDSVTSIGSSAFSNCSTDLVIYGAVGSVAQTYANYYQIVFVAISGNCGVNLTWSFDSTTGTMTIQGSGEMDDYSFKSAPWYDFQDSIKKITIGDSVTSIGGSAFVGCASLMSVIIGNSVTSIGTCAFEDCTSLTSVTIPNSVTSISDCAFSFCNSLTSVTIGNSVTSVGYGAFADCTSLTSVTIPDSVKWICGYAFSSCNSLTSVEIGNSVTSIGDYAFTSCDSLTSVTIPTSVTSIGEAAFAECERLAIITVASENPNYSSDNYGVLFNKDKTQLIQCPGGLTGSYSIPNSVTSVGDYAFFDCTSLTNVTIQEGVTSIGHTSFCHCTDLTSVTIPGSVTSINRGAFSGCESLADVYYGEDTVTWLELGIEENNEALTSARIHWNTASAEGHWTYVNSATCTNGGIACEQCACGYVRNENETPALGHDFVDGVCTRCGAWDPDLNTFTDIKEGEYFFNAVLWAYYHVPPITTGTTATTFAPKRVCTRSEIVTFLWRAEGQPEPTSTENPFTDVVEGSFYYKAVLWAVEKGITSGTGGKTFSPKRECTRSEVVTFLWRAAGKPEPTTTDNPFKDVVEGSFYYKAVLWAVEQGITKGTSSTTFSPGKTCTRGEVVTFLYRAES